MDPKTLNALVHDREAAYYDDRFSIEFDERIARDVRRDLAALLERIPHVDRALDVACGTGYGAIGLAAAGIADEVHACDLSLQMLLRTRANAGERDVPLTRCDAEVLPYAADSFDLVVARGALHHVPDPLSALMEVRRVLKPGGTGIVLAEPTPSGEKQVGALLRPLVGLVEGGRRLLRRPEDAERRGWELAAIAANLHTFEPEDIGALAEKAGFEDIQVGTASWAWVLALGVNYYLVGEFEHISGIRAVRAAARRAIDAAAAFDRLVGDRAVPARWRHTIQAVLR